MQDLHGWVWIDNVGAWVECQTDNICQFLVDALMQVINLSSWLKSH